MRDHLFSGEDAILVFQFLIRLSEECDTLPMAEAQALMTLIAFLKKSADTQFNVAKNAFTNAGGITTWPEAVNYLFQVYATPEKIRRAVSYLRAIGQDLPEE